MRKLIVDEWITLDGVAQATPMEEKEDTTGGFQYGGWHMPYADEVSRSGFSATSMTPADSSSAAEPTRASPGTGRTPGRRSRRSRGR